MKSSKKVLLRINNLSPPLVSKKYIPQLTNLRKKLIQRKTPKETEKPMER